MGYEMQLAKNVSKIEPRSLGLGLLIGCFLIVFTYISMSEPFVIPFTSVNSVSSPSSLVPSTPTVEDKGSSQQLEKTGHEDSTQENEPIDDDVFGMDQGSPLTKSEAAAEREVTNKPQQLERENMIEEQPPEKDADHRIQESTSANNLVEGSDPQMFGSRIDVWTPATKPVCDLHDPRTDVCDMAGDVRIHGRSSSVVFVDPQRAAANSPDKGPWVVRPYSRKWDATIMAKVREVNIRLSAGVNEAPCAAKSAVPAVVFATGGYTGSFYHDFNDVLVPLFTTARQFDGEVQLLISHMDYWWVLKYREVLKQLSHYEVIEFDKDDQVRCYPHAVVGLLNHKDMSIDPARTPKGYSMPDFTKLLRAAYSLDRDAAIRLQAEEEINPGRGGNYKKPRLLIISRGLTRKFVNIEEIAGGARRVGFEVVVSEARFDTKVPDFARVVNSCDVLMGVHGAGLTNEIFLPPKGIVIQVVPWGGLEEMGRYDYGDPAIGMGLRYLEYSIKEEESTLIELYPRDSPVFKDPKSIREKGWLAMGEIFMFKQNVKLDMARFSPVLLQALELLKQ